MVRKEVNTMTIEQRIQKELDRLSKENTEIHSVAVKLNEKFNELIGQVEDHLREISNEMREYDKHDASHSKAVLEIIEKLLQERHIEELTLLEAMVLRFCCYFHDTGMILPAFCKPLLEQVENDPKAEPKDGLMTWLKAGGNNFDSRKELFLLPGKRDQYLDFLIRELMAYRDFRLGLEERPEDIPPEDYIQMTRHHYLRRHHGERSKTYAANLGRFFSEVIHGSEAELAEVIGDVCAAHSWEIEKVRKLPAKKELFLNCTELSCNVRYLAMLLRLGDLLHFGPERASKTLYLERRTMNPESDLHWLAKQGTRGYVISPTPSGGVNIAYHGSFDKPKEYYFVQGHLSWVDEELNCYEAFRRQMEKASGDQRYDLGLPEKVNGDHMTARGFTPNRDFKFRLEHRNIIELLMGARLYRDEFMCLRELYQNALDACRCMRAERPGQETEIEFGLDEDDDGMYLYCRDQGTGMTMDIIKNYLLRIGNSYYKSDEFRLKNAHWGDAVAPVSEFGIGLLSCYMIADRIDVITRHYTAVAGEKPIWISVTDNDDFGYQRETNWFQENELGDHGTIVKLYLKEKFISMVTGYIPEEPRDAVFLLDRCDPDINNDLSREAMDFLIAFKNSLYHRVQQFVHIPETGIPVLVRGIGRRERLFRADEWYDIVGRYPVWNQYGISLERLLRYNFSKFTPMKTDSFITYFCCVEEQNITASVNLLLPTQITSWDSIWSLSDLCYRVCGNRKVGYRDEKIVYIDGIPIYDNLRKDLWDDQIRYCFRGQIRPRLSVDRGELLAAPNEIVGILKLLKIKLAQELTKTIRKHIRMHPEMNSPRFWGILLYRLADQVSTVVAGAILKEFSVAELKGGAVCGASLYDWFYSPQLVVDGDVCDTCPDALQGILMSAIAHAESIQIDAGKLHICRTPGMMDEGQLKEILNWSPTRLIQVDTWPEKYADYDISGEFPTLVAKRSCDKMSIYWNIKNRIGTSQCEFIRRKDPLRLENPDWRDVLLFLQEPYDQHGVHPSRIWFDFKTDGNRRYLSYIYVPPRNLNAEEEGELARYAHVPDYIRGVREGWSILYYNYKDGYVIAPGIQKREDMLKLLPKEVLEHDDGLEYYFTDDTFAF